MSRVLVVEDDPKHLDILKAMLARKGHESVPAVNGGDAWSILSAGGQFDLVMSDNDIPRLSGVELLRKVRGDSRTANVKFILMSRGLQVSVKDATPLRVVCEELGAEFVTKPLYGYEFIDRALGS